MVPRSFARDPWSAHSFAREMTVPIQATGCSAFGGSPKAAVEGIGDHESDGRPHDDGSPGWPPRFGSPRWPRSARARTQLSTSDSATRGFEAQWACTYDARTP